MNETIEDMLTRLISQADTMWNDAHRADVDELRTLILETIRDERKRAFQEGRAVDRVLPAQPPVVDGVAPEPEPWASMEVRMILWTEVDAVRLARDPGAADGFISHAVDAMVRESMRFIVRTEDLVRERSCE